MNIGTIQALNRRLRAIQGKIELRMQHWSAYTESGGEAYAQAKYLEAKACRDLVVDQMVQSKKAPDHE